MSLPPPATVVAAARTSGTSSYVVAEDGCEIEVVQPEWMYQDTPEYNYRYVLLVKEQRRMGTARPPSKQKTTPQAPACLVRVRNIPDDLKPLLAQRRLAIRADLWSFGVASKAKHEVAPDNRGGHQLKLLRANVFIAATDNVVPISKSADSNGYHHCALRFNVTRGARVQCRKNHVAMKLSLVTLDFPIPLKGSTKGPSSIEQPDFAINSDNHPAKINAVPHVPYARTARMSISEKAMCPRECDRKRKIGSPASKTALAKTQKRSKPSAHHKPAVLPPQQRHPAEQAFFRNPVYNHVEPPLMTVDDRFLRLSRFSFTGAEETTNDDLNLPRVSIGGNFSPTFASMGRRSSNTFLDPLVLHRPSFDPILMGDARYAARRPSQEDFAAAAAASAKTLLTQRRRSQTRKPSDGDDSGPTAPESVE